MKICLYLQASDLINSRKTPLERLNNLVIRDEKHNLFKKNSIEEVFTRLKQVGVDGLEVIFSNSVKSSEINKIKRLLDKFKLPILNIHQSNDNSFSISLLEIEKLCKVAKVFNTKVITLHINSLGKDLFDSKFVAKLKNLEKKYRLKFGVENMPKTPFNFWQSYTYEPNEFLSTLKRVKLSITFDATHLAQVNGDLCDFYLNSKNEIINIHLSDFRKNWLNQYLLLANGTHLPLGKGDMKIKQFLEILKKQKYPGHITMEVNGNIEDLCESARLIGKYTR